MSSNITTNQTSRGCLGLALLVIAGGCNGPDADRSTDDKVSTLAAGAYVFQAEAIAPQTNPQNPTSNAIEIPPGAGIISYVSHGAWAKYSAVPFGAAGTYRRFVARMGTAYHENHVKVYLDGPGGQLIADLSTWASAGFGSMIEESTPLLAQVSGTHDLYIEFDGSQNRQDCQTYCWGSTVDPETCQAYASMGCGFGIGNFDWFALAPMEGTQIAVTLNPPSPVAGQPFMMNYNIVSASGVPVANGFIAVNGGSPIHVSQQGQINTGTTLPAGSYTYTVTYEGPGYVPSSLTFNVGVSPAP